MLDNFKLWGSIFNGDVSSAQILKVITWYIAEPLYRIICLQEKYLQIFTHSLNFLLPSFDLCSVLTSKAKKIK